MKGPNASHKKLAKAARSAKALPARQPAVSEKPSPARSPAVRPSFTPRSLVVGALPLARGARPNEVAFHAASMALDSERLCLIVSVHEKQVYYLAGLASDFGSQTADAGCELSACLPGLKGHRGEGIYWGQVSGSDAIACVIYDQRGLRCFVGDRFIAEAFPAEEQASGLPMHIFDAGKAEAAPGGEWRAYGELSRRSVRLLIERSVLAGFATLMLAGLAWVGASVYGAHRQRQEVAVMEMARSALAATVGKASNGELGIQHPAWREYLRISAGVLTLHGALQKFELANGRTSWSCVLPAGTSKEDIYRALGRTVKVQTDANGLVLAQS